MQKLLSCTVQKWRLRPLCRAAIAQRCFQDIKGRLVKASFSSAKQGHPKPAGPSLFLLSMRYADLLHRLEVDHSTSAQRAL
jgi:hypothetical protein